MAVGLHAPDALAPVAGIALGSASLGLRAETRDDLLLMEFAAGTRCAAMFTRNAFRAAPVQVAREHLQATRPRALLINAGNANAGTGLRGIADAEECCAIAAELLGCRAQAVLPFSTGVIGEPLAVERFRAALPAAHAALGKDRWLAAARAIMTTDTVPKGISASFDVGGTACTLTGIAKGSGMIRPDLATLLTFVATDAALGQELLDGALREAVADSFNRITVDGDTSTNDSCVLLATGASGARTIMSRSDPGYAGFAAALAAVTEGLAQAIVRDAEGATKFVAIEVTGGRDPAECREVAYTVAHSPLVKTALYASDANWGRILAAVGRAGIDGLDVGGVRILLNGVCIVEGGSRAASYSEEAGTRAMAEQEIRVTIDLGRGAGQALVWTCDLSHQYVTINAEYRS